MERMHMHPGSSSATNFLTFSVAEMLIPLPKIHNLDRDLSRRQTTELPAPGRALAKKEVAVDKKLVAVVKKISLVVQKFSRSGHKK